MSGIGYPRHVNFRDGSYISVANAEEESKAKQKPGWFEFPDVPPKTETIAAPVVIKQADVIIKEPPKQEEKRGPGRPRGK
jgi:hypothetical protein